MKINYCLNFGRGKPWVEINNGYYTGSAFIGNEFLTESAIRESFKHLNTIESIKKFVSELNGSFAITIILDGVVVLIVDRERTIPLYYEIQGDVVTVYNHISLDTIKEHGLNQTAFKELDDSLFVAGRKNLAQNIYGVMAGELLEITHSGEILSHSYYILGNKNIAYNSQEELYQVIDEKFIQTTKRLIQYLNGRCAVIPLSGGHDSRLLVYYLKLLGYDNIFTYTYGPKDNFETETSKRVAEFLDVEWRFVEYKPKELRKLLKRGFYELMDYYSNGTSSVCIQDWYAVDFLHTNHCIPEDGVFVPGHSFDCVAGSFILPKYIKQDTIETTDLIKDIIWKHFSEGRRNLPENDYNYFSDMICASFPEDIPETMTADEAFKLYQIYNIRERQAKYICTSVKTYEYYGYDWYLPLWDKELVDLWESLPLKEKYDRKLFFDFTEYKYPALMEYAPVKNQKIKTSNLSKTNVVYRLFRKVKQLINYREFHYCLAYFSRIEVYKVFFSTHFLNIGIVVNYKMKNLIRRKIK